LVLENASNEGQFTNDPYVKGSGAKSILCLPLIHQSKLGGILYLENRDMSGVFTRQRLEVLNLLSSQIAGAIENATLYENLQDSLKEQKDLTQAYSRFVPREFLSFLKKESITEVKLGDQVQKEMTVLFSDIRGFTSLSESMTPQENFNFINSYLKRMGPFIDTHHGFIDKYIGDAIMALFPRSADSALAAAIAMLKDLRLYNEHRKSEGYLPIRIGIGLNTGKLMLGTVGDKNRMDGTVISDDVNLASRIEGMTKMYGASLLISETTYSGLNNPKRYLIRIADRVMVKGKKKPITVYEVFDGDEPERIEAKKQTLTDYQRAYKLYCSQKFDEAGTLFEKILGVNPDDGAAKIYIDRCKKLQHRDVPKGWTGVTALKGK